MAALHCDDSDLIDLSVDQFFDIENYYEEISADPQGAPSAKSQSLSDPRPASRTLRPEPYHEQVESSEVAAISQSYANNFAGSHTESLQAPSKHHTTFENESFPWYRQPSTLENPNAELQFIENELEEVELRLKRRELQRRRHELLNDLSTEQRAQISEHPQVQKTRTARISPTNNSLDEPYNTPDNASALDPLQKQNAVIDSRYDLVSTNPLSFEFDNLPTNPQGASSYFGVPEQFNANDARPLSLEYADVPNSMPAPPPDVGSRRQDEMQTSISAFSSNQASWQPLSAGPQYEQNLHTTQGVSTFSSIQYDQAIQSPDKSVIIRKRPRLPQPTKARALSAIQYQLAKQTGVPEASLGVMCFNTKPLPKRSRTGSQKQNKKDVQNGGGSCFLCLINKKKVLDLKKWVVSKPSLTHLSVSAPVNGLAKVVETTGRNGSTIQQISRGPVTSGQS